jgi:peptidyl-tRNA hydrolase, PTH1 family
MGGCRTGRREERNSPQEHGASVRLIVGLGNPGREYQGTRHNVGFEAVDRLGARLRVEIDKRKFGGLLGQGTCESQRVLLLKPLQYMNCSGQVVATTTGFYKVGPADVLVITDDMALEPGRIRLRARGSSGGHNGLADIIEKLGTDGFARLRIGIGAPAAQVARDYVLSRPPAEERARLDEAIGRAVEAALCWLEEDLETAMNRYNVKTKDETQMENES